MFDQEFKVVKLFHVIIVTVMKFPKGRAKHRVQSLDTSIIGLHQNIRLRYLVVPTSIHFRLSSTETTFMVQSISGVSRGDVLVLKHPPQGQVIDYSLPNLTYG